MFFGDCIMKISKPTSSTLKQIFLILSSMWNRFFSGNLYEMKSFIDSIYNIQFF
ncbi:hypothetical protein LEP1GSC060_2701 [Leptospira weilii serovar Ranarum str. ICFT]|uniref:Uncharacterized protein n=1 Tax=Leptospira weilii serovar Ranarum str. ICFT TaxID=1218598 RepID=N1WL21_9LEPT|nr:hypothetical protein LEP1GSC060_2701 [Leptospira weilii serovar Ranarum str. ICFT]